MPFPVLPDANVLVNAAVRDTLFRAAEYGLYQLVLSEAVLLEMRRALISKLGLTEDRVDYLFDQILGSFKDTMVEGYEGLIPSMTNQEKDRYVLAAAVKAQAEVIVTFNLKDFPEHSCGPYGIEVQRPDEFLVNLWRIDAQLMAKIINEQAENLTGWSVQKLLNRLRSDVPTFVAVIKNSGYL